MSKKCKRCGACQECGAVQPQPYTIYPQPWGINPYWRVYPTTYPGWQSGGTYTVTNDTTASTTPVQFAS